MRILAGICAAGKSSRMGFDKLSTPPNLQAPEPLLARTLSAVRGMDTLVALPPLGSPYEPARREAVGEAAQIVHVEGTDFSDTLKALAQRAHGYNGLLVMLADMPFVTADHVSQLVDLFKTFDGQWIVRATSEDLQDGHPVIIPASILPEIAQISGDHGARDVVSRQAIKRLTLPSNAATWDVDTPQDWHRL
ncbi:nucleotidyltransferase family protein [Celeribacter arenosi]|uniref:Nucleotidyltransferase family protein n=1 Tax=Celeribacter arenosi TaxID=792649 RepID=A0ABP7KFQ5_9RHOB